MTTAAEVDAMRAWAEQRLGEMVTKLKVFGLPVQPVASERVAVGPTFARLKVVPLDSRLLPLLNPSPDLTSEVTIREIFESGITA
ncbi:MAG TPA: hypothetical protein VH682_01315, partial [Gemmataceae bacterium]